MIKIDKTFNSISCNTRLRYQFNKDKSRFTATDSEIFTDLTELKTLSESILNKNSSSPEYLDNLPQKRKKSGKSSQKTDSFNEDDLISVLASLTDPSPQGRQVINPKKFFDSNLKELIQVVFASKSQRTDASLKNCRASECSLKGSSTQKILKNKSRAALRLYD
jgi:hypothetical protein